VESAYLESHVVRELVMDEEIINKIVKEKCVFSLFLIIKKENLKESGEFKGVLDVCTPYRGWHKEIKVEGKIVDSDALRQELERLQTLFSETILRDDEIFRKTNLKINNEVIKFMDEVREYFKKELIEEINKCYAEIKSKIFTNERGEHQFGYGIKEYYYAVLAYHIPHFCRFTTCGNRRVIIPSSKIENGIWYLMPPEEKRGFWIGKGGQTIRELQRQTGRIIKVI
jgi:hypothetical protein